MLVSAFQSAGQRCSALRVLRLQRDVAPQIKEMLAGAMEQLAIGDPALLATDVGPVIDVAALDRLTAHARRMDDAPRLLFRCRLPASCASGTFFGPATYEIDGLDVLTEEVFGPILHVLEYDGDRLDALLAAIDAIGYGLTLGIHSRIESGVRRIAARVHVGNIYVNRTMIGAHVGCQPFGGERLSGTGPKAGGPWYLPRFATERVVAVDTAVAMRRCSRSMTRPMAECCKSVLPNAGAGRSSRSLACGRWIRHRAIGTSAGRPAATSRPLSLC
jgi:RHH-type transcriptional regulator, proline utilization regulon repressor / proline dehydrogenase / delta 1-pyrroline-5-carboxylate dehydrogenase